MTWHNSVLWTEGMFLQPQHFQQHDRYLEAQTRGRLAATGCYPWGYLDLAIDTATLSLGKIALRAARGLTADGLSFSIPGEDAAPAAYDVPTDTRDEIVVLALALPRPGIAQSNAETSNAAMPPRLLAQEIDSGDVHAAAQRLAPIQIGRLNLRIMLQRDASEGYACLGLCRIIERRADNRIILDESYVPPTLHASDQAVLGSWLRELHGLLHQRGQALAARMAQPGRAGVGEIADFLLLQAVNRAEPIIAQMRQQALLHPYAVYLFSTALAGELATFREGRRPSSHPAYQHDDLGGCFRPVMDDLRLSLSMVLEQTAIPIELQDRKYGIRVAILPDIELQRTAQFVLAVAAQIPGDSLRARFPTQVKIGTVERIRDLVNLQLPGVGLRPLPVAPRQIPYHAGFAYFELDTRGNEMWKQLESSGGLAMHIAGDFPGLELEFWAVRG